MDGTAQGLGGNMQKSSAERFIKGPVEYVYKFHRVKASGFNAMVVM